MAIKEWLVANPKLGIVLVAVAVTLVMTLITKYMTNQTRMKELKGMQKEKQEKLKNVKNDEEKNQITKEIMEHSMEMLRHSFKPMFITLLPILLIFWWVKGVFVETVIAKSWIWYYIGSAIISSIIFRKALDVA
ncbi:MAG: EMC3/TMCO1 family protein [Nanoarchaeota archaeon]